MTRFPTTPTNVDTDPIDVRERNIRQVDCPNIECDSSLDITNIKAGTKVACAACKNTTWIPEWKKQKIPRWVTLAISLFVSFLIGFLSSIAATKYLAEDGDIKSESSEIK